MSGTPGPARIGVVTEAFASRPLHEVMDWLARDVPEITGLEIGTGYAPTWHCDTAALLRDKGARNAWRDEIVTRGFGIGALNAWGNPLHPDPAIARRHDSDLKTPSGWPRCSESTGWSPSPAAHRGARRPDTSFRRRWLAALSRVGVRGAVGVERRAVLVGGRGIRGARASRALDPP